LKTNRSKNGAPKGTILELFSLISSQACHNLIGLKVWPLGLASRLQLLLGDLDIVHPAHDMRSLTPSSRMLKLVALGALSFWLPDTLWHAARGANFNGVDVLAITFLLPLTLLVTFLFLTSGPTKEPSERVGLQLMLGVWMFGGFFIAVGSSFANGGFLGPDGFRGGVITTLIGFIPPFTFIMSAYDGSLGAIVLTTLAAVLVLVNGKLRKQRHQQ
jgi:hypothetical protein